MTTLLLLGCALAGCASHPGETLTRDSYRQECNRYFSRHGIDEINGLPYSQVCAMLATERMAALKRASPTPD